MFRQQGRTVQSGRLPGRTVNRAAMLVSGGRWYGHTGHSLVMLKTTCLERSKSAVSLGLIKLNHLQESPLIGAESDLQSMR
jgi:hypothetical protein